MAATRKAGMTARWPAWNAMNWLRLMEGPHNLTVLPVAPTMKKITYRGETYNRMPDTRSPVPSGDDGEGLTGYGGAYLWDGWWEQKLAEMQAKQDGAS